MTWGKLGGQGALMAADGSAQGTAKSQSKLRSPVAEHVPQKASPICSVQAHPPIGKDGDSPKGGELGTVIWGLYVGARLVPRSRRGLSSMPAWPPAWLMDGIPQG